MRMRARERAACPVHCKSIRRVPLDSKRVYERLTRRMLWSGRGPEERIKRALAGKSPPLLSTPVQCTQLASNDRARLLMLMLMLMRWRRAAVAGRERKLDYESSRVEYWMPE